MHFVDIKPPKCELNKLVNQIPVRTWSTLVLNSHNKWPGSPYLRQPPTQSTWYHRILSNFCSYLMQLTGSFTPPLECRFPPTLFPNRWALVLKGTKSQSLLLSFWDGYSVLVITDSPRPPEEAGETTEGHRMCGPDRFGPAQSWWAERRQ